MRTLLHCEVNSHFFQVFCLWRGSLKLWKDPFPLQNYLFIYLYTVGFMVSYFLQFVTSIIYLPWYSNYCSFWHREPLPTGFCVFLICTPHSLSIFFYFISGTKRYPWFLLADNLFREQVLGIKRAHFYWYLAVLRPSQWTETPTHAHFHEVILILQIPICQHWKDSFQFSFSNIYFIYLLTVRSKTRIILFFSSITLYTTSLSQLPVTTLPSVAGPHPPGKPFIFHPFDITNTSVGSSHTHPACTPSLPCFTPDACAGQCGFPFFPTQALTLSCPISCLLNLIVHEGKSRRRNGRKRNGKIKKK